MCLGIILVFIGQGFGAAAPNGCHLLESHHSIEGDRDVIHKFLLKVAIEH